MCVQIKSILLWIVLVLIQLGLLEALSCISCSHDNPNCVQNPKATTIWPCLAGFDKCFTAIGPDGSAYRGCYVENHHSCQGSNNCTLCDTDNCNDKILPENRLACHHCSGEDCLKTNSTTLLACLKAVNDDQCYTFSGSNRFVRGCKSDAIFECKDQPEFCTMCNSTGCNAAELKPLKCYDCHSKDGACKRPESFATIRKIACEPDADGNLCYTHVDQTNFVTRGCVRDGVFRKNEEYFAEICKTEECNKKMLPNLKCPQCTVETDKECAEKDFKDEWIKGKACDQFTSVCHVKCVDDANNIFRGCGKSPAHARNCTFCYANCDRSENESSTPNPTTSPTTNPTPNPNPEDKLSCFQCRSDVNSSCKNPLASLKPAICKMQGADIRPGCFTLKAGEKVLRGCQADFTEPEYVECEESADCKLCDKNDCNNEKSSAILHSSVSVLIGLAAAITLSISLC